MDIKWQVDNLRIYYGDGDKEIVVSGISYTFKDINVLDLLNPENAGDNVISFSTQVPDTQKQTTINFIVGKYALAENPNTIIKTMIQSAIEKFSGRQLTAEEKFALNKLQKAQEYMAFINNPLLNIIEILDELGIQPPNFIKDILNLTTIYVLVTIKICPLLGITGLCGTLEFDLTEYINKIGYFFENDVKKALNTKLNSRYAKVSSNSINIPGINIDQANQAVNLWNNAVDAANAALIVAAKKSVDVVAKALTDQATEFVAGVTYCQAI